MFYLVKTPLLLKKLYPSCIWNFSRAEKSIYLTFDDGPHPLATPFVLDALRQYGAKATFFCLGKNAAERQAIYQNILADGHAVGNHTHNHLNGASSSDREYIDNIRLARKYIDSNLFRPPYGRITKFQVRLLTNAEGNRNQQPMKIIMWDVLSADFDTDITGEKCARNVCRNSRPGSIVVFHDSEKAFPRLEKALPETLRFFVEEGYQFRAITA